MTISKDRVKPSPLPDSWKLSEIFATGVVLGSYLALMSVVFFWLAYETNFFPVIPLFRQLAFISFTVEFCWSLKFSSQYKEHIHAILRLRNDYNYFVRKLRIILPVQPLDLFQFLIFFFSWQEHFNVRDFNQHHFNMTDEKIANPLKEQLASAVYLQVSTISQALIFVTRSRSWSFRERPGLLLVSAFIIAQLVWDMSFHSFII